MINEKTILSSFDDKETLLKWLKKTEQALDMSVLTSIEPMQTSEGYFNLKFNFKDGTSIETPTAIQLKGFKGDKGDKGDRGDKGDPFNIIVIPSGSDILTFDFSPYASGQLFIGTKLTNMPSEIDNEHSQVVVQLLRNNSTLYCLKLWNTGLYQGNQGEYIIYHYADAYAGWKTITTDDKVFDLANVRRELSINAIVGTIEEPSYKSAYIQNNLLTIIFEGSVTFSKDGYFNLLFGKLSSKDYEKIFRLDGSPCNQRPSSVGDNAPFITRQVVLYSETGQVYSQANVAQVTFLSNQPNNLTSQVFIPTLKNAKVTMSFRIELKL